MVTGPLVNELTLVKSHQRLAVYLGQTSNSGLAGRKADVFKINVDDDDEIFPKSQESIILEITNVSN